MKRWFSIPFLTLFTKTQEGYGFSLTLSIIIHLIIMGALMIRINTEPQPQKSLPIAISAALVHLPKPVPKPQIAKKPVQQKNEKEKVVPVKHTDEHKKTVQKKNNELALKREEQRRTEELLKKEEEEKKRTEQQMTDRERMLALEQQVLQEAQQLEYAQLEQARYAALIKNLTSQYWNRPPSARNNMVAEVVIRLSRFGDVLDVSMIKSSGNDEFDHSVIQAIRRASPFHELKNLDRSIFDQYFRRITFRFRPEDLVR